MVDIRERLLTPAQLDNLGLAMLEMAKEMWVMKDRQMVTESLLREKNLLPELDTYQPGPELSARLAAERDRFRSSVADWHPHYLSAERRA